MTQFISEIIELIKTLNYRDFIKIILFLIILILLLCIFLYKILTFDALVINSLIIFNYLKD
jgi:hypothetical protein